MNCSAFETWLDEGMPAAGAEAAARHAAGCAGCAGALAAARALDAALAAGPARAPAAFTERVMERVAAVGPARVAAPPAAPPEVVFANPALPWWVRAAADPACVLALLAAGLLLWGWSATPASWKAAPSAVGAAIAGALLEAAGRSALLSTEALRLGLAIAALPGVLWIAYVAFRWAEGLPAPANRRAIRLSGR